MANFATERVRNGSSYTLSIQHISKSGYYWDDANSETTASTGSSARTMAVAAAPVVPGVLYPNPFSHTAELHYAKESAGYLSVVVYKVDGTLAEVVVNKQLEKGSYTFLLGESIKSTGVYFVVVKDKENVQTYRPVKNKN